MTAQERVDIMAADAIKRWQDAQEEMTNLVALGVIEEKTTKEKRQCGNNNPKCRCPTSEWICYKLTPP